MRRSRHGRGGERRAGGRRSAYSPAAHGRLVREYVGQTGDDGLGGERESLVTILHRVHHFEYELGLPEHLQIVDALLQYFRDRLLPPGLVQLIGQFLLENEYRHFL